MTPPGPNDERSSIVTEPDRSSGESEQSSTITPQYRALLEKQHYEIVGNHSAVEVCGWTKKSLRGEGVCFKQKFYNISSHRCCQMTPVAIACDQKCVYCWRANEHFSGQEAAKLIEQAEADDPVDIIEGSIEAHLRKLTGFKGNNKVTRQLYEEARRVRHFAISLTGEPTLYRRLPELIRELHTRELTSFLVTNGLHPEVLRRLRDEKALPTQLYLSLDAPDRATWKRLDIPLRQDYWERLLASLDLMAGLDTRKVIRLTLVRGWNDHDLPGYARLIRRTGEETMVEVKSYMWLGYSRRRLDPEHMLSHEEVLEFAGNLAAELGWQVIDHAPPSRVALVALRDWPSRKLSFPD